MSKISKKLFKTKITSISQYKAELENGTTNFDFSKLNLVGDDIQNVNLENLGLNIDLRKVFVPYSGRYKTINGTITPSFSAGIGGEYYLKIKDSRLGGNNVTGDLTYFNDSGRNILFRKKPVYIWYSEETFDDKYKLQYPQFFISKEAPTELRDKYYNPKMYDKEVDEQELFFGTPGSEETHRTYHILERQTLTFDEYLKYYKFLKGKYLGNFSISKQDLLQIQIIEQYGLDQREAVIEQIKGIINTIDCEDCTIDEVNEKNISLKVKLKVKHK